MDVYKYIAESNPSGAQGIIESFGYEYANTPDMCLSQLVTRLGEPALKKVMENHPDKEIILEMFSENNNTTKCGCGCGSRKQEGFLNANGGGEIAKEKDNSSSSMIAQQTNAMILVSALFIFTALMIKK
jgi:hypothetical protein